MLSVQKFLRDGSSLEDLQNRFAIKNTPHPKYPNLVLLKYDQIDSPFEQEIVRDCRGLILDRDDNWKAVNYSLRKFFNYGEPNAESIDWKTARVFEKADGSLTQLFFYDNMWHIATSGSPDASGQVGDFGFTFEELFWKTFWDSGAVLPSGNSEKCFFLELTSQFNKIVVRHDKPSLTLLGARDLSSMQELSLEEASIHLPFGIPMIKSFPLSSFEECISSYTSFRGVEQEGYVICDANFNRVKMKHPEYLHLHRLKDGLSSRRALIEVVRNGDLDEILANLPEYTDVLLEAKSRLDALISELEGTYDQLRDIEEQKSFALRAIKESRCSSALFSLRAKKTESFRTFFREAHIDTVVKLLGYKTE
jgi:hypothetical protein